MMWYSSRRLRRSVVVPLAAALGLAAPSAALAQEARSVAPVPAKAPAAATSVIPRAENEAYYGVYLKDAKVGSVTIQKQEAEKYKGRPAVRYQTQMDMDLTVMGAQTQIKSLTTSWTDPKTGAPLAIESRSESGGKVSTVRATYSDRAVSYEVDVTGSKKSAKLELKPGENWLVDPTNGANVQPRVGMKFKGKVFLPEPAMLQLLDSEIEIVAKETIEVNGQAIPAFKVVDKNPVTPTTSYMTESGDLLRSESLFGIQIRREPKEMALAKAGTKTDILSLVGLRPTGLPLEKPRTLRTVKYEISGIARGLPQDDNIQSVTFAPSTGTEAKTATVTVTTRPLPDGPTVPLYKSAKDAPKDLQPYLQNTLYVQSDQKRFKELAKEILAGETDSAKAAAKISAYVHKLMRPDPTISGFRAASDLLKEPRGVCRDYTLLYTTIARAAGLPTKQCVGIAYANGIFVGHAWPEVWVGNNTWIALEPTWGVPFADATHIKLAEGEITDFLKVAADMDTYKIKVLSAE
jgi:transglutaminase-like putative cysteine protease